ncbi:hypothetical protein HN51_022461 [Arachis hypogaea]|uniref:Dof zinc finger protein n=2 Tax=Arachis TaxID=3817 RepID=A0A445ECD6_ARAHY|nr:dof zinc finger protein DOF2.4-like [Arachis duranensis]XP_025651743.1 dof zinc finger protein DOF2.4 [Arachis hypogaea]XP_057722404.1 dof zinc finger protein DOF2.4-like [Arachis stenosperma]QHO53700.1 Dof zinc finger protein [Arachis hypogaea]RYR73088.1 hypothetical protein Ahy_A02g007385 [Arachis hypogaea]
MVFTSIPAAYLEAAANWQQHQQQQQNHQPSGNSGGSTSPQLLPPPPPPPPQPQPHGAGGGAGSIRPGSMADRARMANLPMPEASLRCPRCESTNTKFCYFNNYSLSQPRHFCKTCRRYWTRGGALRNVPVGGGCRRNKRSKGGGGGSSRSPAASSDRQTGSASSTNSVSSNSTGDIVGLGPSMPPLRFMAPLHHHQLTDFATASGTDIPLNYNLMNYTSISGSMGGVGLGDLSFQIGNPLAAASGGSGGGASGGSSLLSGLEQWRIPQQFPFMAGLEGSSHGGGNNNGGGLLYPFEGSAEISGYVRPKVSTSMVLTQLASVKMEDSRELNNVSSGQFLMGSIGNNNNNTTSNNNVPTHEQYWNGATGTSASASWTELSGFSSSSTTSNNQL